MHEPSAVNEFSLQNHQQYPYTLEKLMGNRGVLIGFVGDIWLLTAVRRVQWFQSCCHHFLRMGVRTALISRNQPHTLYNFYTSSPVPPSFPLLADADGAVHRDFAMSCRGGLALVDSRRAVRAAWPVYADETWPPLNTILHAVHLLGHD